MDVLTDIEIIKSTMNDLEVGIGIFEVEDLNDIESIRYVFMNKVILYEMRKNPEEVIGKKIIEVAPEAYQHEAGLQVIETYRKIAAEGGSVNLGLVQYSNEIVGGTYECSVHHLKDHYVYVMLRNVTDLEQTKNELERKNIELERFAAIVSHDLKEPINSIYGLIELIRNEYKLGDEVDLLIRSISNTAVRMKSLVTNLLDFVSIGEGKTKSVINLNTLVENVKEDLASTIKETNATIDFERLPEINGYETELHLLFQNLISNSIKFTKPYTQPKISITAFRTNRWIFSIEDNGIGISEAEQDKIFNIFERLHSKSEYAGTGIGLAHCKKIVEMHGGELWVDSEVGKGSTFHFSISD